MSISGPVATYVVYTFAIVSSIVGFIEFWRNIYPTLKDTLANPLMRLLMLGLSWLAGLLAYITNGVSLLETY
jgi:hypothetical protein